MPPGPCCHKAGHQALPSPPRAHGWRPGHPSGAARWGRCELPPMCPECGLPPPEPHFQGVTGRVDTGAHGSRASPRPRPTLRPGAARVPFLSPRAISWSLMTDRRRAHAGGEAPGGRTRPRLPRGPVPRGPGPRKASPLRARLRWSRPRAAPGPASWSCALPLEARAGRVPDGVVHQVRHGAAPWAPVRRLWGAHVADAEPWGGRVTRGVCTHPRGTAGPHVGALAGGRAGSPRPGRQRTPCRPAFSRARPSARPRPLSRSGSPRVPGAGLLPDALPVPRLCLLVPGASSEGRALWVLPTSGVSASAVVSCLGRHI